MDQPWFALLGTLLKSLQMEGSNNDNIRCMIQEELRKSQNHENSEALKQLLTMVEQRHAAQLDETNREKERYKMQVEFLTKQVHELNREKRTAERTDKMKELLTHMAGLNIGNQHRTYKKYQNQNAHTSQSYSSQGNREGANLPWMDHPKGKMHSSVPSDGQTNKPFQKKNFHTHPNQNFQNNPEFQHNKYKQDAANVQSNSKYQYNQNMQHTGNFQQKQYVQQPQRGQPSNRYRGRGQQGATGRGRGRSLSVGRNNNQFQTDTNNATLNQTTSSFHVHVTKVGTQQWMSTENISAQSHIPSQRGRGNTGGRGRENTGGRGRGNTGGRGRGNTRGHGSGRGGSHGNTQQGEHGGPSTVKKNRKKNPQTGGNAHQNVHQKGTPRNKNNVGDPEDNCRVS